MQSVCSAKHSIGQVWGFLACILATHIPTRYCDPFSISKILFIYLCLERGREGDRGEEKYQRVVASHTPPSQGPGPGPQPRHVPLLGIELATLWFTGQHSIHWATPARAPSPFLNETLALCPLLSSLSPRLSLCLWNLLRDLAHPLYPRSRTSKAWGSEGLPGMFRTGTGLGWVEGAGGEVADEAIETGPCLRGSGSATIKR